MKIIDLTHLIHETMPVYPNAFAPSFQQIATVKQDGFQETKISITSHTGTHMDAPRHLFEKRDVYKRQMYFQWIHFHHCFKI